MANTGYKVQPRLKKVSDDVHEYPLDINGNRTSDSGLPQATMDNDPGNSNYKILDETACPTTPVTINYSVSRDTSPYVDGNLSLQKNSITTDLITFVGSGVSSGGYIVGDLLSAASFHYHLAVRWPDDATLTMNIREGGIGGTIVYTYTGGSVSSADVDNHSMLLSATEYTVQVTTNSSDASLRNPPMGYELINNTSIPDGFIKISVIDTTTSLIMLGQNPSEVNVPATGSPRLGAYNVKNDANTQTVVINNTSGTNINITLSTAPNGGVYTDTFALASGASVNKTGVDKVGFRLTVNT